MIYSLVQAVPALYSSRPVESAIARVARDLAHELFCTVVSGFCCLPLTGSRLSLSRNILDASGPPKNLLSSEQDGSDACI